MFHEARDFAISNSSFHIQTNQYGRSGIDILREASSLGAVFDSKEHNDRRCFPGTREQYIIDINNWATASDDALPSIYWMWGPAGVGKSAIAQTCAEKLEADGYLGAAFFFTVKNHNSPLRLFTTIAYQLATILPEYRAILDDKISKDKALIEKRLSSQFRRLIVEPLQELKRQGRRVGRRAIFVDGLDECAGEDAQAEIIGIIASSVQTASTPFRWAIFSRSEPRIVSTFNRDDITFLTHSVELPISREVDGEIELYLRGEFQNILQRQNRLQLSSSWPTNENIKTLVDAAAGLFAHPAAVLRFVGYPSDWQFQKRLQDVLDAILRPGKGPSVPPLAELDALYLLIMNRIPDDILVSVQLFLYWLADDREEFYGGPLNVTMLCSELGFSEPVFRRICHLLHAVIAYQEFFGTLSSLDPRIDLTRSFYDQGEWFQPAYFPVDLLYEVHGLLSFHHKSFYDFLIDPARSSTFCITSPAIRTKFFDCCIQQHHHFASNYVVQGSKLISAPDVASFSASLPWPQGTEFVDSFLNLGAFFGATLPVSHDRPGFGQLLEDVPMDSLRKLAGLDYRKELLAEITSWEVDDDWPNATVVGHEGTSKILPHTTFECLHKDKFGTFRPVSFLAMVKKLEKLGVIRPYHPRFGSSRATSIFHTLSWQKSYGTNSGLYKFGHGDKSVIWYWKFDMEKRYYHQFRTVNYGEAVKFYKANKFTMWEEEGERDRDGDEDDDKDRDEENDLEGDGVARDHNDGVDNGIQDEEGREGREDEGQDEDRRRQGSTDNDREK